MTNWQILIVEIACSTEVLVSIKLDACSGYKRDTIDLFFKSDIELKCQRCNNTMNWPLWVVKNMEVLPSSDRRLCTGVRSYYNGRQRIYSIVGLLEDEILLSVPYAPLHEDANCC